MRGKDGLLLVDKPAGISSFDVVRKVRGLAGTLKVGHTGTLDPDATGLLAIGLGRCTKLAKFLVLDQKHYRFSLRFGASTTTDDSTGDLVEEAPYESIEADHLRESLSGFLGEIKQIPPVYSALRIDGKRAYERARAGETVVMAPRTVRVDSLKLLELQLPDAVMEVKCGPGTYVRALARDLGKTLGSVAHTTSIRRLAVGPFRIEDAHRLEELTEKNFWESVLSPLEMVQSLPRYQVDAEERECLALGQPLSISEGQAGEFGAAHVGEELIAVVEIRKKNGELYLWPRRVML